MMNKIVILIISLVVTIIIVVLGFLFLDKNSNETIILQSPSNKIEFQSDNENWSYLEWQKIFPDEKKRIESFNAIVQSKGMKLKWNIKKPVSIAIVYPAIQSSDYWIRNVTVFEARLREIGIPYQLKEYYSAPGETQLQHQQIIDALESNIDYLVTTIDESADLNIMEKTLKEGKVKVIIQNVTTPLKRFGSHQPLLYTGFDHELGSIRLAKYFLQKFPDGANWIMLLFTDGIISQQRGDSFKKEILKNRKMNLLSIYKTDGKRDKSMIATLNAINTHTQIDFIYSCATDVTLGAVDALDKMKMKKNIFINGWGGGSAELNLLTKNMLDVTVMRMNDDSGVSMAEAISLDLQNRQSDIPAVFSGSYEIINSSMSYEIDILKKRAFRYSSVER
ncbi:MAG TPA: substrate-binding domain-containing protein [Candidatus Cloacimonadota bacterium]|nr:substrate-binding domain-containing protein [Candidatus Cloacimonadota bacterium]